MPLDYESRFVVSHWLFFSFTFLNNVIFWCTVLFTRLFQNSYSPLLQGKEVIGVLGYRFGKSASSLVLSAITHTLGIGGLRELSYCTTTAAALWLGTAWRLSNLVPTRAAAEEAYEKMKREN